MKAVLIAISLVFFLGCSKKGDDTLRRDNLVLTAVLRANSQANDIRLFTVADNDGAILSLGNLAVTLSDNIGNSESLSFNGSGYSSSNMNIVSGRQYRVHTQYEGKDISAVCNIPPAIVLVNVTNSTVEVDPDSEGVPITSISWNELSADKYAYVLKLENLEQNKVAIPFEVTSGNFDRYYQTPIVNHSVTLFDTDFKYYGLHRLTVFAIERKLESVYFYDSSDIRGLLQFAPDNVTGAQGFFTGVSSFSVDLLIQ